MDKKKYDRLERAISPTMRSSSGHPLDVAPKPIRTPDWEHWPANRRAELWEVVALSLNIDPDSLEFTQLGHIRFLRDPVTLAKFLSRVKMLAAIPPHVTAQPLSQWVAMLGKLPMPEELAALAAPGAPNNLPLSAALPEAKPGMGEEPQKEGAGGTTTTKEAKPQPETGEPFLQQKARNSRAAVDRWVKWQAHQEIKDTDKTSDLAARIWAIADQWEYQSERGPMTIASITKMLPSGLTGGRSKNKSIKGKVKK